MSTSLKTKGKCEVFLTEINSFSRQTFTLGVISKQHVSALKLARMTYFFHVVVICQEFFFFFSVLQFSNSLDILSLIMVEALEI